MSEDLERYKQEAATAAVYMDLKARHFAAFLVLNGALLLAAFQVDALVGLRLVTSVLAITVTALFMRLDRRTGQYLTGHLARSEAALAALVGKPDYVPSAPRSRFGASAVSTSIYVLVVAVWIGIAVVTRGLAEVPRWACDRPAADRAPTAGSTPVISRPDPASPVAAPSAVPEHTKPPPVRLAC